MNLVVVGLDATMPGAHSRMMDMWAKFMTAGGHTVTAVAGRYYDADGLAFERANPDSASLFATLHQRRHGAEFVLDPFFNPVVGRRFGLNALTLERRLHGHFSKLERQPDVIIDLGTGELHGLPTPTLSTAIRSAAGTARVVHVPYPAEFIEPSAYSSDDAATVFFSPLERQMAGANVSDSSVVMLRHGADTSKFYLSRRGFQRPTRSKDAALKVLVPTPLWTSDEVDALLDALRTAQSMGFRLQVRIADSAQRIRKDQGMKVRALVQHGVRELGLERSTRWEVGGPEHFAELARNWADIGIAARANDYGLATAEMSACGLEVVNLFTITETDRCPIDRSLLRAALSAGDWSLAKRERFYNEASHSAARVTETFLDTIADAASRQSGLDATVIERRLRREGKVSALPQGITQTAHFTQLPGHLRNMAPVLAGETKDGNGGDLIVLSPTDSATNLQGTIHGLLTLNADGNGPHLLVILSDHADVAFYRMLFEDAVNAGKITFENIRDHDQTELLPDNAPIDNPSNLEVHAKRNLGLRVARRLKFRRITYLDHDIYSKRGVDDFVRRVKKLGNVLDADGVHAASSPYDDFMDKSWAGYGSVKNGEVGPVFMGSGALSMWVSTADPHAAIYNEDWLVILRALLDGKFATVDSISQFPSFPFRNPARAVNEVAGEWVAMAVLGEIERRFRAHEPLPTVATWRQFWSHEFFETEQRRLAEFYTEQLVASTSMTDQAAFRAMRSNLMALEPIEASRFVRDLFDSSKRWTNSVDVWSAELDRAGVEQTVGATMTALRGEQPWEQQPVVDAFVESVTPVGIEDLPRRRLALELRNLLADNEELMNGNRQPDEQVPLTVAQAWRKHLQHYDVPTLTTELPTWRALRRIGAALDAINSAHQKHMRFDLNVDDVPWSSPIDLPARLAKLTTMDPNWFAPSAARENRVQQMRVAVSKAGMTPVANRSFEIALRTHVALTTLIEKAEQRCAIGSVSDGTDQWQAVFDLLVRRDVDFTSPSLGEALNARTALSAMLDVSIAGWLRAAGLRPNRYLVEDTAMVRQFFDQYVPLGPPDAADDIPAEQLEQTGAAFGALLEGFNVMYGIETETNFESAQHSWDRYFAN